MVWSTKSFRDSKHGGYLVAGLGEVDYQPLGGLCGLQFAVAQQVDAFNRFLEVGIAFSQRLDDQTAILGPTHSGGIEVLFVWWVSNDCQVGSYLPASICSCASDTGT